MLRIGIAFTIFGLLLMVTSLTIAACAFVVGGIFVLLAIAVGERLIK